MNWKTVISLSICAVLLSSLIGCSKAPILGRPIDREKISDGVYDGVYEAKPVKAVVEISVESGKIITIKVVKHDHMKGGKAESIIPKRIIDAQSTKVDAVSGATRSSIVIMNAVQDAVEKAYKSKQ